MWEQTAVKDTVLSFKVSTIITIWAVLFWISSIGINTLNNINNRIDIIETSHEIMSKHFDECESEIENLKLTDNTHKLEFTKVITEINSDIKAIKTSVKTIETTMEKTY